MKITLYHAQHFCAVVFPLMISSSATITSYYHHPHFKPRVACMGAMRGVKTHVATTQHVSLVFNQIPPTKNKQIIKQYGDTQKNQRSLLWRRMHGFYEKLRRKKEWDK
jgi:hypothetical protein